MRIVVLILVGLCAGLFSGLFGIGGGVVIVPGLVFLLKYSLPRAVGTSLAVLLPPIGAGAVLAYYRAGQVDFRAALILAAMMVLGAWLGALAGERLPEHLMRVGFGLFLILLGAYSIWAPPG